MSDPIDVFLWVVAPYLTITLLIGGTVWRYRYDKFGWTTRSTQLLESRLLRIGNPIFHFGLLFVLGGHVFGLLVPERLTALLGIDNELYHLFALSLGTLAGAATLGGLTVLVLRRRRVPAIRLSTTGNDIASYLVLASALVLGMVTTVLTNGTGGGYDYRETIAPWFRGIFLLHPDPALLAHAPQSYQLHTLVGMLLFAIWPFTRLVHAFSAPLAYLVRPYIIYRSREGERIGTRAPRRGWEER